MLLVNIWATDSSVLPLGKVLFHSQYRYLALSPATSLLPRVSNKFWYCSVVSLCFGGEYTADSWIAPFDVPIAIVVTCRYSREVVSNAVSNNNRCSFVCSTRWMFSIAYAV